MTSIAHWLEIDLLRAGERPPEVRGTTGYYVLLKRAGAREAEVWPLSIRDPLPTIAVALLSGQADVPLDLQIIVEELFERYRYAEPLEYRKPPHPPSFSLDDAQWVATRVQRWQQRHTDNGTS